MVFIVSTNNVSPSLCYRTVHPVMRGSVHHMLRAPVHHVPCAHVHPVPSGPVHPVLYLVLCGPVSQTHSVTDFRVAMTATRL